MSNVFHVSRIFPRNTKERKASPIKNRLKDVLSSASLLSRVYAACLLFDRLSIEVSNREADSPRMPDVHSCIIISDDRLRWNVTCEKTRRRRRRSPRGGLVASREWRGQAIFFERLPSRLVQVRTEVVVAVCCRSGIYYADERELSKIEANIMTN